MVVVYVWEGLGNQLFQYAFARALQLRTGQAVYLDTSEFSTDKSIREYGLSHFRIQIKVTKCSSVFFSYWNQNAVSAITPDDFEKKRKKHYGYLCEKNNHFKPELLHLDGIFCVKGWFQSERYFQDYAAIIRKELLPEKKIQVSHELKALFKNGNLISVHIRRGDFTKTHNTLPRDYYDRAINEMRKRVANPHFLVFTDDLLWTKNNIDFGDSVCFIGEKRKYKDYEELLIMSRCDHHIIANSTFSWWGAWLNPSESKLVIAPKKWLAGSVSSWNEIIPDGWIQV